jgi:hypothetical protein
VAAKARGRPPKQHQVWAASSSLVIGFASYHALHLEKAAEPPDLEEGLADDDADDKHVPPLDTGVCALGGVAVSALAHDDVLLLVLDLGEKLGERAD